MGYELDECFDEATQRELDRAVNNSIVRRLESGKGTPGGDFPGWESSLRRIRRLKAGGLGRDKRSGALVKLGGEFILKFDVGAGMEVTDVETGEVYFLKIEDIEPVGALEALGDCGE